jgi:hypothetical protein
MHVKINITELKPNFLLHIDLVQNKPKKPTNTLIAIMDLDIHIYE